MVYLMMIKKLVLELPALKYGIRRANRSVKFQTPWDGNALSQCEAKAINLYTQRGFVYNRLNELMQQRDRPGLLRYFPYLPFTGGSTKNFGTHGRINGSITIYIIKR